METLVPGSAWEHTASPALPAWDEAEPRNELEKSTNREKSFSVRLPLTRGLCISRKGGFVRVEPGLQILNGTKTEHAFRQRLESLKRQPTDCAVRHFREVDRTA